MVVIGLYSVLNVEWKEERGLLPASDIGIIPLLLASILPPLTDFVQNGDSHDDIALRLG